MVDVDVDEHHLEANGDVSMLSEEEAPSCQDVVFDEELPILVMVCTVHLILERRTAQV